MNDPSKNTHLQITQPLTLQTLTEKPNLPDVVFAIAFTSPTTIAAVGKMQPDLMKNLATQHVSYGSSVIQFWNFDTGEKTYTAPVEESVLTNVLEASVSGEHVAFSFTGGGDIHLWNKDIGHELNPLNQPGPTLAFSPDEIFLASGDLFGHIALWNKTSGALVAQVQPGQAPSTRSALEPMVRLSSFQVKMGFSCGVSHP